MSKFLQKSVAVLLALVVLNLQAYAVPFSGMDFSDDAQELISFDEDAVYSEFDEIAELSQVLSSEDLSVDEISSSLTENIAMEAALPLTADEDGASGAPLGIPSFLWGCLLSWVGIILVYFLTEENKDETKKAVWGCVAGSVAYIAFYVLAFGLSAASSAATY